MIRALICDRLCQACSLNGMGDGSGSWPFCFCHRRRHQVKTATINIIRPQPNALSTGTSIDVGWRIIGASRQVALRRLFATAQSMQMDVLCLFVKSEVGPAIAARSKRSLSKMSHHPGGLIPCWHRPLSKANEIGQWPGIFAAINVYYCQQKLPKKTGQA